MGAGQRYYHWAGRPMPRSLFGRSCSPTASSAAATQTASRSSTSRMCCSAPPAPIGPNGAVWPAAVGGRNDHTDPVGSHERPAPRPVRPTRRAGRGPATQRRRRSGSRPARPSGSPPPRRAGATPRPARACSWPSSTTVRWRAAWARERRGVLGQLDRQDVRAPAALAIHESFDRSSQCTCGRLASVSPRARRPGSAAWTAPHAGADGIARAQQRAQVGVVGDPQGRHDQVIPAAVLASSPLAA